MRSFIFGFFLIILTIFSLKVSAQDESKILWNPQIFQQPISTQPVTSNYYIPLNNKALLFNPDVSEEVKTFVVGYCNLKNNCADHQSVDSLNANLIQAIQVINPNINPSDIFGPGGSSAACDFCNCHRCGDGVTCYDCC